jgi:hypothetical protein
MIQLTKDGVTGDANMEELKEHFERAHVFRLHRLLHPDLMQFIYSRLELCGWTTRDDGKIAREAVPGDVAPACILNFALNTPEFLDVIRRISRCEQISWFFGRVYRMTPGGGHFDSWHADISATHPDRLLGMSINLGAEPYHGGVFRLRDEANKEVLCELPNTGQGDAIFFRISTALKHMVTPLEGTVDKTAFAGWFRSGKVDFYSSLRPSTEVTSAD